MFVSGEGISPGNKAHVEWPSVFMCFLEVKMYSTWHWHCQDMLRLMQGSDKNAHSCRIMRTWSKTVRFHREFESKQVCRADRVIKSRYSISSNERSKCCLFTKKNWWPFQDPNMSPSVWFVSFRRPYSLGKKSRRPLRRIALRSSPVNSRHLRTPKANIFSGKPVEPVKVENTTRFPSYNKKKSH